MSQNLSSAAVVIGALRLKRFNPIKQNVALKRKDLAHDAIYQLHSCLLAFQCKNSTRDERRPLEKLHLVDKAGPTSDKREITSRFDLDPGSYFIVPFCLCASHTGQYMVRVLAERDPVAAKTGW